MQVQQDYEDIEDIIRMCQLRIRVPEQWWGDYLALLGAARIGERELLELGARGRLGRARDAMRDAWFDYSEQRMIAAIRALPAAASVGTSTHDPFPGVPEGVPVNGDGRRQRREGDRSRSTCATTSTAVPAAST